MSSGILPLEAFVLRGWLLEKFRVAFKSGAARFDKSGSAYNFFLAGPTSDGVADVTIFRDPQVNKVSSNSNMVLRLRLPAFSPQTINLELSTTAMVFEADERTRLRLSIETISPLVMGMEIAPYPNVPYALINDQEVVGFAFFAQLANGCKDYDLYLYLRRNVGELFPFTLEPDRALRLQGFWSALYGARVRVISFKVHLETQAVTVADMGAKDAYVWVRLSFNRYVPPCTAHPLRSQVVYWAWDAETRTRSDAVRLPCKLKWMVSAKGFYR